MATIRSYNVVVNVSVNNRGATQGANAFNNQVNQMRQNVNQLNAQMNQLGRGFGNLNNQVNQSRHSMGMWGQAFKGAFIGAVAGLTFSVIIGSIATLTRGVVELGIASVKAAGDFELTTNALAAFTGSTRSAKKELAEMGEVAQNTPGLRLEASEQGFQRLRALGFEAKQAKAFIKELGEEKILSGASDEALDKIIFNFAQIASGGQKVSQELREILTQMPSMRNAFFEAFGTLDPKKIQVFFDKNNDEAFRKLTDAMTKQKAAAGGLNDAWGKAADALLKAGRQFGEPFLEPITNDLKTLSVWLEQNGKDWQEWARFVADAYKGVSDASKNAISGKASSNPAVSTFLPFNRAVAGGLTFGTSELVGGTISELNYALSKQYEQYLQLTQPRRNAETGATDAIASANESVTAVLNSQSKIAELEEKGRQQRLDIIGAYHNERMDIIRTNNDLELAQLDTFIADTVEQEIELARKRRRVTVEGLRQQYTEIEQYYREQIQLNEGNATEQLKLTFERNQKLRGIHADIEKAELRLQRELQEKERQILEDRRKAQIDFTNTSIEISKFRNDVAISDIERALDRETISIEQGYSQITEIINASYAEQIQLSRESYQLQLQDKKLTVEQRANLEREMYFTEEKLAEENRQKVLEIEDKKYQAIERRIERNLQYIQSYYASVISITSEIADVFFNPNSFTSANFNRFDEMFTGIKAKQEYERQQKELEDLRRKKEELKAESIKVRSDVSEGRSSDVQRAGQIEKEIDAITNKMSSLDESSTKLFLFWNKLQDSASATTKEIGLLGQELTKTLGAYENFDKIAKLSLKERHKLERESLQAEVEAIQRLMFVEKERYIRQQKADLEKHQKDIPELRRLGITTDFTEGEIKRITEEIAEYNKTGIIPTNVRLIELEERLRKVGLAMTSLNIQQTKEEADLFAKSIEGLNLDIKLLAEGDISKLNGLLNNFKKAEREEIKATLIEIRRLEYDLANPDLNAENERKLAILQKQLEIRNREADALTRIRLAELELREKGKYSKNQDDANVLEFLAQQKGITEIVSDAKINAITAAYQGLDRVAASMAKNFGFAKDAVQQLISSLLKLAFNKIFQKLFGINADGTSVNLFGRGGVNQTPNFNPNASGVGGAVSQYYNQIFGGGGSQGSVTAVPGDYYMPNGGIRYSGLANLLPPLGAPLPNQSGGIGSSAQGGLGGFFKNLKQPGTLVNIGALAAMAIGSSIGGVGGSALQYGGMGAMLGFQFGGLLGAGIGAAGGALFGLFAGIFGRNARRRREEKLRNTAMGDAFRQLDKLIEDVNADRIDGASALEQAEQIRANYVEQMNQLKDKKTRSHALKDVSRIDAKISELKSAVAGQKSRRERLELFAPTFADGGTVSGFARNNFRNNPLGYQQGRGSTRSDSMLGYFPRSNTYARFSDREYILDAQTASNIGVHNLDLMRETKGASFVSMLAKTQGRFDGGSVSYSPVVNTPVSVSQSASQPIQVHIHVDGSAIGEAIANALAVVIKSNDGSTSQMSELKRSIENDGQNGLVQALAEAVKAKLGI